MPSSSIFSAAQLSAFHSIHLGFTVWWAWDLGKRNRARAKILQDSLTLLLPSLQTATPNSSPRLPHCSQFPWSPEQLEGCSEYIFLSYIFWWFDIWGLPNPGGTAPAKGNQLLEIVKDSPVRTTFICKPTNAESISPTSSSIGLSYSEPLSTCPNHPGNRYQTIRDSSYVPKPQWDYSN